MEVKRLLVKSVETIKEYGFGIFFQKVKNYLKSKSMKKKMSKNTATIDNIFGDVLFINGCYLPHPSRYRVSHQREQMLANGMISEEVFFTDLKKEYVKRFRLFIFYRCPYTEEIGEFIKAAKSFNKPCLFDIDDLVIDTKYTDKIPYLKTMNPDERKDYDKGVNLMQKTLLMCDGAITTTEALAKELKNYVPEVFINRNTASDTMAQHSKWAVYNRDILPAIPDDQIGDQSVREKKRIMINKQKESVGIVKIGYFSGSITHNDDINFILPVINKIMAKHDNVHLYFAGELDIPVQLKKYSNRIHSMKFVEWQNLPELIADVDINIVPLCDTIFNAAKSENKWVEAALVKVPTIASKIGAFEKMIVDGETGLLCADNNEWFSALELLIKDKDLRKEIAGKAYTFVTEHCLTINSGLPLCEYIRKKMTPNIAFVLPSTEIGGGVLVVLKHCCILKKAGYDVVIINDNVGNKNIIKDGEEINVLSTRTDFFHGRIDVAIATLWTTTVWVSSYQNILKRGYLVQGFETGFYDCGDYRQFSANQTYSLNNFEYITISRWCKKWLNENYHRDASFMPNGLELSMFPYKKRKIGSGKIRILIEGNSDDYFKNVDESFKIVEMLDKDKYEIWFMSYLGSPKSWYRVDKFMHKVPYEIVSGVYNACDILIKSSIRESFSYPPLEMMATGGYVVVRPNEGNVEYLRDGENCLMYDGDNLQTAVDAIERIYSDPQLRERLYDGGLRTAKSRDWSIIQSHILELYNMLFAKI